MKTIILFFILLPVSACLKAQEGNSVSWDMPGGSFYFGPDQSPSVISKAGIYKEERFQYSLRGKKIKDSILLKTIFYDSTGKITAELRLGHKHDTVLHNFYYDTGGLLYKEIYSWNWPEQRTSVTEYKEDKVHPATRFVNGKDTTEWRENQLYYDDRHRLIMRYQKQALGDPIYEKYSYDENDRLVHREVLDPAGQLSSSYDIAYDDVARSKIISKNINGLAYPMYKEYYNEKMQLIKSSFSISSLIITYNDDGTEKEIKKSNSDLVRFFYNRR